MRTSKRNCISESRANACITAMGNSKFQAVNCLDMFHLEGGVQTLLPYHALKPSVGGKARGCVKAVSLLNRRAARPSPSTVCIRKHTHVKHESFQSLLLKIEQAFQSSTCTDYAVSVISIFNARTGKGK